MYKKITTTTVEEYSDDQNGSYPPSIKTDIPLMIRLLEFAREEASSDIDLHALATNLVSMSQDGRTLTMSDYPSLLEGFSPKSAI
jgi:hypothetical protein